MDIAEQQRQAALAVAKSWRCRRDGKPGNGGNPYAGSALAYSLPHCREPIMARAGGRAAWRRLSAAVRAL